MKIEKIFPRVESLARSDKFFARTVATCWKVGETKQPVNAERFEQLLRELKTRRKELPLDVGALIEKERDRWP